MTGMEIVVSERMLKHPGHPDQRVHGRRGVKARIDDDGWGGFGSEEELREAFTMTLPNGYTTDVATVTNYFDGGVGVDGTIYAPRAPGEPLVQAGTFWRSFSPDSKTVTHNGLTIDPAHQRKGIATGFIGESLSVYERVGYRKVIVPAEGNPAAGWKVWAKPEFGFRFADTGNGNVREIARDRARTPLEQAIIALPASKWPTPAEVLAQQPGLLSMGWTGVREVGVRKADEPDLFYVEIRPTVTKHLQGKHDQATHGKGGSTASRIAAGHEVDVPPAGLAALLDDMADRDDDPNLTLVNVTGTSVFNVGGDHARHNMPQVPSNRKAEFVDAMRDRGRTVIRTDLDPLDLKPTQGEISGRVVGEIVRNERAGKGTLSGDAARITVSSDGYVLDGHHRWAAYASMRVAGDEVRVSAFQMAAKRDDALEILRDWNDDAGVDSLAHGEARKALRLKAFRVVEKHLPGKHDQSTHGRGGGAKTSGSDRKAMGEDYIPMLPPKEEWPLELQARYDEVATNGTYGSMYAEENLKQAASQYATSLGFPPGHGDTGRITDVDMNAAMSRGIFDRAALEKNTNAQERWAQLSNDRADHVEYMKQVDIYRNDGPVVIAAHPGAAYSILTTGKIKTQFESGTSNGMFDPTRRAAAEVEMFGHAPNVRADRRTVYGFVAPPGITGTSGPNQYGSVRFVLKRDVEDRTTITIGDSLGTKAKPMPKRGTVSEDDYIRASAYGWGGMGAATLVNDPQRFQRSNYVEAQIHGGVSLADVAEVHLPYSARPGGRNSDRLLNAAITQSGLPVRYYAEGFELGKHEWGEVLKAAAAVRSDGATLHLRPDILDSHGDPYAQVHLDGVTYDPKPLAAILARGGWYETATRVVEKHGQHDQRSHGRRGKAHDLNDGWGGFGSEDGVKAAFTMDLPNGYRTEADGVRVLPIGVVLVQGTVWSPEGTKAGVFIRSLHPQKRLVEHTAYRLNPEHQRKGVSTAFVGESIGMYEKVGYRKVVVGAAQGYETTGWKVWAKPQFGFRFDPDADQYAVFERAEKVAADRGSKPAAARMAQRIVDNPDPSRWPSPAEVLAVDEGLLTGGWYGVRDIGVSKAAGPDRFYVSCVFTDEVTKHLPGRHDQKTHGSGGSGERLTTTPSGEELPDGWGRLTGEEFRQRSIDAMIEDDIHPDDAVHIVDRQIARGVTPTVYTNGAVTIQIHPDADKVIEPTAHGRIVRQADFLQKASPVENLLIRVDDRYVTRASGQTKGDDVVGWTTMKHPDKAGHATIAIRPVAFTKRNPLRQGLTVGTGGEYVMAHEWGHAIVQPKGWAPALTRDGVNREAALYRMFGQAAQVSGYAMTQPAEFFAEMFADWHQSRGTTKRPVVREAAREFGWFGGDAA